MASALRADLLFALPPASRRGAGGRLPAANSGGFPAALLAPPAEALPALPTPQLQIRSRSGWAGEPAHPSGVGRLARPGGAPTAAAGPLSTTNYLRLSFAAPLPAAVLAAQPEIWLFTHHSGHRPAARGGLLHQAGWSHPAPHGAATEFGGAAVQQGLAQPRPFTDIVLDANHWVAPCGQPEQVRRLRFALVVAAPAGQPTPAGKHLGPLSPEVWLGASPRQSHTHAFHTPAHNPLYH